MCGSLPLILFIVQMMMAAPSLLFGSQRVPSSFSALIAKMDKLKMMVGKNPQAAASPSPSNSVGNDLDNKSSLDFVTGIFGIEKSNIMDRVEQALEELKRMTSAKEPLWVECGGRKRNTYIKEFSGGA